VNKIRHKYQSEFVGSIYIFGTDLSMVGKFLNVLINNAVNR